MRDLFLTRSRTVLVAVVLAALSRAAIPGDDASKVRMDDLSKAAVEEWDRLVYRLDRAGMKRCSFTVQITAVQRKEEAPMRVSCSFQDGVCSMEWAGDAGVDGIHRSAFARVLADELQGMRVLESLAGCSVTGAQQGNGSLVLTVEGAGKAGWKKLVFDDEGMLTELEVARDIVAPTLRFQQTEKHGYTWRREEGGFLKMAETVSADHGRVESAPTTGRRGGGVRGAPADMALGVLAEGTRTYVRSGAYIVPQGMEVELDGGMIQRAKFRFEFSDWKFDAQAQAVSDNCSADPKNLIPPGVGAR